MGTSTARQSQTYAPTIGAGIHWGACPFLRSAHRLVRRKNNRHITRRRLHNRWQPIHFKVSLIGLPRLFDWRLRGARAKVLGNELASPQTEIKQYVYQSKGDGMNTRISRRGFVGGTAALGATALATATTNQAHAEEAHAGSFESTVAWDAEYDVVIIGYGLAGETAAIQASEAGASVLIVDKADAAHVGGNSRYAMQVSVDFDHTKRDEVLEYFKKVRGSYNTPSDAILEAFVDGTMENIDWATAHGANLVTLFESVGEFQNLDGWDLMNYVSVNGTYWDAALYHALDKAVQACENVTLWLEAPATDLIQDSATKIVHGVTVEVEGQAYNVRAKSGVILAAGGFEANMQMAQDFVQLAYAYPKGGLYNTGDGIKLATAVGADLWHMSNASGPDLNYINPETNRAAYFAFAGYQAVPGHSTGFCSANSAIIVGADGTRFHDEGTMPGHGFVNFHGMLLRMPVSLPAHVVCDDAALKNIPVYPMWDNQEKVEDGTIVKADTLAELDEKLGLPEGSLEATVERYNGFCSTGIDDDFGRLPEYLVPIAEEGPYYALEVKPAFTNTMGGPVRDEQARVIDVKGEPIPHLFSAGECGSVWGDVYQGGANIGECLVFGRIAGTNAAAVKDDVNADSLLTGEPVDFAYTPADPLEGIELGENEYAASVESIGGPVVVKVTMDGDAIKAVEVVKNDETPGIGSVAVEKMPARIIEANSIDVDTVAGATCTSRAIIGAVAAAVAESGK